MQKTEHTEFGGTCSYLFFSLSLFDHYTMLSRYEVVMSFDVESYGQLLEHPVPEVGLAVVRLSTGALLRRQRFTGHAKQADMELRCKTEFWDKIADVDGKRRKHYEEDAPPQKEMWSSVLQFMRDILKEYPGKVLITSDNCAFDAAFIAYNFQKYLGGPSMQYLAGDDTNYTSVEDSSEWITAYFHAHSTIIDRSIFREVLMKWFMNFSSDQLTEKIPMMTPAMHGHYAYTDAHSIANDAVLAVHYGMYLAANKGVAPF